MRIWLVSNRVQIDAYGSKYYTYKKELPMKKIDLLDSRVFQDPLFLHPCSGRGGGAGGGIGLAFLDCAAMGKQMPYPHNTC